MTRPAPWGDMFRAHTCFKALVAMSAKMQPKDQAAIRSEKIPPCRACRAWWRQACARQDVTVRITWPGGTWGVPGDDERDAPPPFRPHNDVLSTPQVGDDGFSVIAVENQSCALWAYRTDDPSADPHVYQADLGDETHGPWQSLVVSRSAFVEAMTVWNEANGGIVPSAVGEASGSTPERLSGWRRAFASPWFTVYEKNHVHVCEAGTDVYAWGADVDRVRHVIRALEFAWSDLEWA